MTERLMEGVGISSGEEPPQVAIGVKPLQRGAQDQQSFVTFRSELLVASLLQFSENHSDLVHYLFPLFEAQSWMLSELMASIRQCLGKGLHR